MVKNAIINIVGTITNIIVTINIVIMMIMIINTLACRGKEKNAQEGHGAVAPVDPMIIPEAIFTHMEKVKGAILIPKELTKPQKKLYEMIWRHTLASQMKIAHLNQVGQQLYGSVAAQAYHLIAQAYHLIAQAYHLHMQCHA